MSANLIELGGATGLSLERQEVIKPDLIHSMETVLAVAGETFSMRESGIRDFVRRAMGRPALWENGYVEQDSLLNEGNMQVGREMIKDRWERDRVECGLSEACYPYWLVRRMVYYYGFEDVHAVRKERDSPLGRCGFMEAALMRRNLTPREWYRVVNWWGERRWKEWGFGELAQRKYGESEWQRVRASLPSESGGFADNLFLLDCVGLIRFVGMSENREVRIAVSAEFKEALLATFFETRRRGVLGFQDKSLGDMKMKLRKPFSYGDARAWRRELESIWGLNLEVDDALERMGVDLIRLFCAEGNRYYANSLKNFMDLNLPTVRQVLRANDDLLARFMERRGGDIALVGQLRERMKEVMGKVDWEVVVGKIANKRQGKSGSTEQEARGAAEAVLIWAWENLWIDLLDRDSLACKMLSESL